MNCFIYNRINKITERIFISLTNKISLILILLSVLAQLLFIMRYSVDVPFWDQFFYAPLLNNVSWRNLFSPLNEHRTVIPKIIFISLAKITHWNVRIEIFFNWVFLFCTAFLLYKILKKNIKKDKEWIIGLSICFFLTPQYYTCLLFGVLANFQINLLAVISGIAILCLVKKPWLRLHLGIICCLIATFSNFNGLFTWITLLPLVYFIEGENEYSSKILFLKRERAKIIYWVLIAIIVSIIYFWGYRITPHYPPLAYPWQYPKAFLLYFLTYLGAPLFTRSEKIFGNLIYPQTAAGIILCLVFVMGCIFNSGNLKKNIGTLCLAAFVFLTAAATSVGRANYGFTQALEARYRLYSVLLPILIIRMLIEEGGTRRMLRKTLLIFLLLGIFVRIFTGWREGINDGSNWYTFQTENRRILCSFQTSTNSQLKSLCPDNPQLVRNVAKMLKRLKYSVFR